jgi:hypothetical protein
VKIDIFFSSLYVLLFHSRHRIKPPIEYLFDLTRDTVPILIEEPLLCLFFVNKKYHHVLHDPDCFLFIMLNRTFAGVTFLFQVSSGRTCYHHHYHKK